MAQNRPNLLVLSVSRLCPVHGRIAGRTDPQVLGWRVIQTAGGGSGISRHVEQPPLSGSQCTFRREFEARYRPSRQGSSHMMTSDFVTKEPPGGGQPEFAAVLPCQLDLGYRVQCFAANSAKPRS